MDPTSQAALVTTPLGEPTMGTVTFTGKSTGFDAVAAWMQTLGRSDSLSDPTVTNVAAADSEDTKGKVFDVESNAFLNANAASNRYLQVGTGE
jgi:Tfp pilus assembly protein PilN